jgi:hypothetical protein
MNRLASGEKVKKVKDVEFSKDILEYLDGDLA